MNKRLDSFDEQAEKEGNAIHNSLQCHRKTYRKAYRSSRPDTTHIRRENNNLDKIWEELIMEDVKNHRINLGK